MVGRERGVAFDDGETLDRNAEFLRRHLAHGGAKARADIHSAGVQRDGAIGMNREEAVHFIRIERLAEIGRCARSLARRSIWAAPRRSAKLTTTAPPVRRKSRLETECSVSMIVLLHAFAARQARR